MTFSVPFLLGVGDELVHSADGGDGGGGLAEAPVDDELVLLLVLLLPQAATTATAVSDAAATMTLRMGFTLYSSRGTDSVPRAHSFSARFRHAPFDMTPR